MIDSDCMATLMIAKHFALFRVEFADRLGLDGLADGTEDNYEIDYLYGHWRVGRTICPARYIVDVQSGLEVCRYIEISPPEYLGHIILWEGQ